MNVDVVLLICSLSLSLSLSHEEKKRFIYFEIIHREGSKEKNYRTEEVSLYSTDRERKEKVQ